MLGVFTSGEWTVIGAVIGVVGIFVYGFLAWVLKRLVSTLDNLNASTGSLRTSVDELEQRVTSLESRAA